MSARIIAISLAAIVGVGILALVMIPKTGKPSAQYKQTPACQPFSASALSGLPEALTALTTGTATTQDRALLDKASKQFAEASQHTQGTFKEKITAAVSSLTAISSTTSQPSSSTLQTMADAFEALGQEVQAQCSV